MKKGFKYTFFFIMCLFTFCMLVLSPTLVIKTHSKEVNVNNYKSPITTVYDTSGNAALIAYVGTIPEVEIKDRVVIVEKVVVPHQSRPAATSPVVKQEVKEEISLEEKFNLGNISINNSNFYRNIIMDDGSYFYLDHDLNGNYNNVGMPIIDDRTNFNTRKTLIYAHSAKDGRSPFNFLQSYHNNQGFYNGHKYITINYGGRTYKYEIFSVYISVANGPYDDGLEYFRNTYYTDTEWDETVKWYKSLSEYDTGVEVSGNDKILILQTCAMDNNYYHKYYRANLLVMGKLI